MSLRLKRFLSTYSLVLFLTLCGAAIGLVVGAICAVFGRVLIGITAVRSAQPMYFIPFLAAGGALIAATYAHFAGAAARGMGLVFDVAHHKEERIPFRLIPLIMGGTWLTHLVGGSAGREGVAVQIGATVANHVQRWLKTLNNPILSSAAVQKAFVVAGMAAGFGGLFRTPLAACAFGIEVLIAGRLEYRALPCALAAAMSASATSGFLGLEKFEVPVSVALALDAPTLGKLGILGVAFGVVGAAFAWLLSISKQQCARIVNPVVRAAVIGAALSVVLLLLWQGRYAGLGTNLIAESFSNNPDIFVWDWALKLLLTVITLGAGFQGGEVTPLFAIGASLGVVLGAALGVPIPLAAGLGYACVFGGATNTLLAPILIGGEVFGFANIPYFVLVCSVGYMCNLNRSIYARQLRPEVSLKD